MSASKFYIWGGGRWREVNTASGEVAGWSRRPRFVFARRGRLRVATRRRVLAALQAHASNLPSAVELGPRLSVLRNEPPPTPPVTALPSVQPAHHMCAHHHCCIYSHGLHNNNIDKYDHNGALTTSNRSTVNGADGPAIYTGASLTHGPPAPPAPPAPTDAGAQPRATADAAVQHSPSDQHALTISLAATNFSRLGQPPRRCDSDHRTVANGAERSERPRPRPRAPPLTNLLNSTKRRRSALSDSDDSEQHFKTASAARRSQDDERPPEGPQKTVSKTKRSERAKVARGKAEGKKKLRSEILEDDSAEEACKELTISESDVLALRSLVRRTRSDALARFDADEEYKRMLFYAINPLVHVERCALTERALRERHALALPHFAARLGLTPTPTPTPTGADADADKENKHTRVLRSNDEKRRAATHAEDSTEGSDSDDELELFQSSRGNTSSIKQNNKNNLRKNIRDLVSSRESYKNKRLEIGSADKGDKNRSSPRLGTRTESNRSSGRAATFKEPEILRGTDENEIESNYKCKIDKFRTPEKSKRENDTSDNKRRSLRRSTLVQSDRGAEDSGSGGKPETIKNGESPTSRASHRDKRECLPRALRETREATSDSSDSEDTHSTSDGSSVKGAADVEEPESSRTRRASRRRRDSGGDGERETVVDSGRGSAPSDERRTLRHSSKRDSTRKSSRISVSAITKDYAERSSSEADSASSLAESVTPPKISAKNVGNGRARGAGPPADGPRAARAAPSTAPTDARAAHAHTISKRASSGKSKEYSNLEDHAIVAWVSGGARARRVNGNALWRELQGEYPRLTGVGRSWHSLRNRYLRYILPALGALRLPPAHVSRLRAAAAAGSLKRRGAAGEGQGRRNSIFDQSQVSAASARLVRPRLARSPTPAPPPPPAHPTSHKHSEVAGASSSARRRAATGDVTAADGDVTVATRRDAPDAEGGHIRNHQTSKVSEVPERVYPWTMSAGGGGGGEGRGARSTRSRKLFNPKLVL